MSGDIAIICIGIVYISNLVSTIIPSFGHQLLLAGIICTRDLGASLEPSNNVRDKINRGKIRRPTLYVPGTFYNTNLI